MVAAFRERETAAEELPALDRPIGLTRDLDVPATLAAAMGMEPSMLRWAQGALLLARRLAAELAEPDRTNAFPLLLERFLAGEPRRGVLPAVAGELDTEGPITEFVVRARAQSHPERVLAIAYWHFHNHAEAGVRTYDLTVAYQEGRIKRPANFPDVVASCIRKGWLTADRRGGNAAKAWVITRSGEAALESWQ